MLEQKGRAAAEQLLEDFGFDSLPIKPLEVAKAISDDSFKVVVEFKELPSDQILGVAMGSHAAALVYINKNITDQGRLNFTIAHELGHVCMHIMEGSNNQFECGSNKIFSNFDNPLEKEANGFASGLLMPKSLIYPLFNGELNWNTIERVKSATEASLEASFRRMISIISEPYAMLIHESGKFKRYVKSDNFEPYINKHDLTADQKDFIIDPSIEPYPLNLDLFDAGEWIQPEFKGSELESVYVSSISLRNNFTYTLLTYDDECFVVTE